MSVLMVGPLEVAWEVIGRNRGVSRRNRELSGMIHHGVGGNIGEEDASLESWIVLRYRDFLFGDLLREFGRTAKGVRTDAKRFVVSINGTCIVICPRYSNRSHDRSVSL